MKKFKFIAFTVLALILAGEAVPAQAPKAKWANFNGVKVRYYDIYKEKTPEALVFVHCWTCNVEFWKDSYNAFPEFRVIAMDLPGHGQSDKPKTDYTMEYFARSIDAVLKKAGVKHAVLVGHSMGTPVVRKYYELFPEKTRGLVVVDGALIPLGPRDQVEKFFEPLYKDYQAAATQMVDGMLQTAMPAVRPFVRESMLATPDFVGQSALRSMLDDTYAPHGKINVPLLAEMAESPNWPKDLEQRYFAIAPSVDFHMWKGVSHFLHLEDPKKFNMHVEMFIEANHLLRENEKEKERKERADNKN